MYQLHKFTYLMFFDILIQFHNFATAFLTQKGTLFWSDFLNKVLKTMCSSLKYRCL